MAARLSQVPEFLVDHLARAQKLGMIGPGRIDEHLEHSFRFAHALGQLRDRGLSGGDKVVDLGSGAGLPGLVLATFYRGPCYRLLEASVRKAALLRQGVRLGALHGVEVIEARAEVIGRTTTGRAWASVVVVRAFGPPSVVAECGAPLLEMGGHLLVSLPPSGGRIWAEEDGLRRLGMEPRGMSHGILALAQVRECPERYPRRIGVPRKRPLFG
ncbi:MAG: RsmG family class I SAM-dependent methyltransferase [Acidimicrobiales bacterium]